LVVIPRAVTAASTSRRCSICDAGEIIGFPDVTVAIPTIGTFTTCRQVKYFDDQRYRFVDGSSCC
jgi:hypothetical protein